MVDRTQTVRSVEDNQAVVRNLDKLSSDLQDVTARASSLEAATLTSNPEQTALAQLNYTELSISATYVQAEIEQLTTDIKTIADKVDALIASLQAANILK